MPTVPSHDWIVVAEIAALLWLAWWVWRLVAVVIVPLVREGLDPGESVQGAAEGGGAVMAHGGASFRRQSGS
jgi:hypothetical protein